MTHALKLEPHHVELASAIEKMNCGLIGRDKEDTIVFANDILAGWLGRTSGELIGLPLTTMIPDELDELVQQQMQAVEAGDIRARITIARRKDFTTFPILVIPHRYAGPDGPFFSVVIELSTVQTAKPVASTKRDSLRSSLERIALELQTIGLTADTIAPLVIPINHPVLSTISAREREVLIHLVTGQRVPAIAAELHISQHTVRNHLKSIYKQFEVGNQSELIEYVRNLDDPKS